MTKRHLQDINIKMQVDLQSVHNARYKKKNLDRIGSFV